jgi:hypothetical protein
MPTTLTQNSMKMILWIGELIAAYAQAVHTNPITNIGDKFKPLEWCNCTGSPLRSAALTTDDAQRQLLPWPYLKAVMWNKLGEVSPEAKERGLATDVPVGVAASLHPQFAMAAGQATDIVTQGWIRPIYRGDGTTGDNLVEALDLSGLCAMFKSGQLTKPAFLAVWKMHFGYNDVAACSKMLRARHDAYKDYKKANAKTTSKAPQPVVLQPFQVPASVLLENAPDEGTKELLTAMLGRPTLKLKVQAFVTLGERDLDLTVPFVWPEAADKTTV